jgi:nicotinate phosphoribosyltransferase
MSGLPNAITVAKEMEERGFRLRGIRLDSGDLAWLARESRKMLDAAGLDYVKIAASNQLDEYVIRSLLEQQPDGALDGVYKIVFAGGSPRIKLSETVTKITIPHRKQVYRMMNGSGGWIGADVVAMVDEGDIKTMHHPFDNRKSMSVEKCRREPLLETVMEGGKRSAEPRSLADIAAWARERLDMLPAEFKRFENPHIYKVGLSDGLKMERDGLIEEHRKE